VESNEQLSGAKERYRESLQAVCANRWSDDELGTYRVGTITADDVDQLE
jgi:hypothetical protein